MEKFIIRSKGYKKSYCRFMQYLQTIGYSKASRSTFDTSIREFFWWLEQQAITDIAQVEEKHIQRFYDYQQERPSITNGGALSESRISLNMYTLRLFFCYQQDVEQREKNPMSELFYPEPEKRPRENLLSKEDIQKLYNACETPKQRALLALLYGCGLRRQEAVKLNARDVHFRNALIYVREGKGGRKRTVPLSQVVVTDLKDYYYHQRPGELNRNNPDSIEAFMLNRWGMRMQGESYWLEIKKLLKKVNLMQQITLHHFRHAIATHLLEGGMKTEHVKDFLGHKSIVTTQTYTHITTTQMKKTTSYGTNETKAIPA